jgi:hypothetical protein
MGRSPMGLAMCTRAGQSQKDYHGGWFYKWRSKCPALRADFHGENQKTGTRKSAPKIRHLKIGTRKSALENRTKVFTHP